MRRIRSAHGGAHAFPVQARVDPDPGAGRRQHRGPADGPERRRLAAVIVI